MRMSTGYLQIGLREYIGLEFPVLSVGNVTKQATMSKKCPQRSTGTVNEVAQTTYGHNLNKCGLCSELGHNKRSDKRSPAPAIIKSPPSVATDQNQSLNLIPTEVDEHANPETTYNLTKSLVKAHLQPSPSSTHVVQPIPAEFHVVRAVQPSIKESKKKRIKRPQRCSYCHQAGHNKAKCTMGRDIHTSED
ncbi:hypothetical protein M9H77_08500 [Catharanthus roseus]|uniref:Uncharacterized protein n=1 Tax=Catharanthus roseus TaxID=4058 RepID=A0ACC0BY47_CATRO|nr:hypothetical protein M9H77_08500 [Catharanthus roseus]